MGRSMDFSEGIRIIREAHADSEALLSKWRELIEAAGEVTINLKNPDGTISSVTLPTIREAINRYLGGVFAQITLVDEHGDSVIVRLNENGEIAPVLRDGTPASMCVRDIIASSITGKNGTLTLIGDVLFSGGSIKNAAITQLGAANCRISKSVFAGMTTISGSSLVEGSLSAKRVTTDSLNIGRVRYRKQVVRFGVEGIRSQDLSGPTNGDIWTGDVSVLEAAGIFPEPTWADCTNTAESISGSEGKIHIYWGTPDEGDVKVAGSSGGYDINATFMAEWPYKMYEKVDGGYRIRWLPLDDQIGKIHYVRVGNSTSGSAIENVAVTSSSAGVSVQIGYASPVKAYSCRRYMADLDVEWTEFRTVVNHRLYKV